MHTLTLIRSDPNTESQIAQIRVWVLRFAQKEGKRGAREGIPSVVGARRRQRVGRRPGQLEYGGGGGGGGCQGRVQSPGPVGTPLMQKHSIALCLSGQARWKWNGRTEGKQQNMYKRRLSSLLFFCRCTRMN